MLIFILFSRSTGTGTVVHGWLSVFCVFPVPASSRVD